jgi:ABC-2 type transport system permease protein
MRYFRLLGIFIQAEVQFAIEYRVNLLLDILEQVLVVFTSWAAILVLFTHTPAINGWSLGQMTVLLGVFYLIQGVNSLVFETSFERFMEHVRLGTLDYILIKPANSQFMVSTRHIRPPALGMVALGVVLLGIGVGQIDERIGLPDAMAFVVTLVCGIALVYCLLLVLSTLSFWFVRVENLLAIFWSFLDAGRFPLDIYPGWLKVTLSTVVPIGVAVTVPAQAVAGKLDGTVLLALVGGTIAVWLIAAWFWRLGLRNYTGASA